MDKNPFNLKIREEKPEGFLDTDEFILFLEKKKIIIRKDNLPRFCKKNDIQMLKFKRIGSGGNVPTCYKIPNDKKIQDIIYLKNIKTKLTLGNKLLKLDLKSNYLFLDENNNGTNNNTFNLKLNKSDPKISDVEIFLQGENNKLNTNLTKNQYFESLVILVQNNQVPQQ